MLLQDSDIRVERRKDEGVTCSLKMEDWIESEEDRAAEEKWVESLPPEVQALARICPHWVPCYRMRENPGHYKLLSYAQSTIGLPPALTLAHGEDSYAPGVAVVGVPPDEAIPCGCGKWRPATDDQINIARAAVGQPQIPEVKRETIH